MRGSKKQAFGDNIYSKKNGRWLQLNSHHSFEDGKPNPANIANDTQTDQVLTGTNYVYWGGAGPIIPPKFRNFKGIDICARRNHKSRLPPELIDEFIAWIRNGEGHGYMGDPIDWPEIP